MNQLRLRSKLRIGKVLPRDYESLTKGKDDWDFFRFQDDWDFEKFEDFSNLEDSNYHPENEISFEAVVYQKWKHFHVLFHDHHVEA